jgi:hypothetical protein
MKAGGDGKQTVFLFSDNQIKEESFVEDINMILNTADIPNLFAAEEKAEILEKMQTAARNEVTIFYFVTFKNFKSDLVRVLFILSILSLNLREHIPFIQLLARLKKFDTSI